MIHKSIQFINKSENLTIVVLFVYNMGTGAVSFFEYQMFLMKQHGSIKHTAVHQVNTYKHLILVHFI
jgi:hypothetical protein